MSIKTTKTARSLAAPQQKRSRRSMERVLGTAEKLFEARTFDQIPVNEIISRSRVSTGAFYARFGSKSGLFAEMIRRNQRDAWQRLESAARQVVGSELEVRVRGFISAMIGMILRDRGKIRAYLMHVRAHPEKFGNRDPASSDRPLAADVGKVLLSGTENFHCSDEEAIIFAIQSLLSVVREEVLFGAYTLSKADDPDLAALASNLAAMTAAYLREKAD